jgi:hypothetical protein
LCGKNNVAENERRTQWRWQSGGCGGNFSVWLPSRAFDVLHSLVSALNIYYSTPLMILCSRVGYCLFAPTYGPDAAALGRTQDLMGRLSVLLHCWHLP